MFYFRRAGRPEAGKSCDVSFFGQRPACGGQLGWAYREIPIGPARPASGQPARTCDMFFAGPDAQNCDMFSFRRAGRAKL